MWEFVRSLGSNLMNGGAELTRTPFPVYINQPRSYLESIADGWVTAPHFLAKVRPLASPPSLSDAQRPSKPRIHWSASSW